MRNALTTIPVMIAATFLAIASQQAHAGFISGNKLHEWLTSDSPAVRNRAAGFIIGVHDASAELDACTGSSVTVGQLHDIVANALARTPEIRHLPASLLVETAIEVAFKCDKPKARREQAL